MDSPHLDMLAVPPAAAKAGLSAHDCFTIRASWVSGSITSTELAQRYNVEPVVIKAVVFGYRRGGGGNGSLAAIKTARDKKGGTSMAGV